MLFRIRYHIWTDIIYLVRTDVPNCIMWVSVHGACFRDAGFLNGPTKPNLANCDKSSNFHSLYSNMYNIQILTSMR